MGRSRAWAQVGQSGPGLPAQSHPPVRAWGRAQTRRPHEQVGHRLSGRRPGWEEQRLFTPGRHLLRQMYQVNAGRAAFKQKTNDSPPHHAARLISHRTRTLTGPSSTLQGCFPAGLTVYSLNHGYLLLFCSVEHASLLERAQTFMQPLTCPEGAS